MVRFLVGLAAMASFALADITYNVIGFPNATGNVFGVSIGGVVTKLSTNGTSFPLWSGVVPGSTSASEYSFVELTAAGATVNAESFVRKLNQTTDTHSDNEFFQRPITRHQITRLPYTYLATYPSKSKVFKENQIATLHLQASTADVDKMNANPTVETEVRVALTFINANTLYTQTNISLKTAGKSSKEFAKQSYKLKFDTEYNQTFFSRPNIKLRAMATEPTMMREKLYIDVLNSVGVPTQQGSYVRLFINTKPYGLFLMVDDIKKSFIKQTVYGGSNATEPGSLIQSNAPSTADQADLVLKGANSAAYNPDVYVSQVLGNNPLTDPLAQLIKLMSDLAAFNPTTTPDPTGYWNSRLDVDGFLRNMALEYLMGAFDNYWIGGSNYFIYFNPALSATGKWQWIPTDFDGTFGMGSDIDPTGSYKNLSNFQPDHPLVSKLIINNAQINAQFNQVLTEIVSTVFKPEAMNPHIDSVHQMISLDAQWDYTLVRNSPGKDLKFTFDDFNNNLNNITTNMNGALKPWVASRATTVSTELKFTLPAGTADRVAPPPRGNGKGRDDDDDEDVQGGNASHNNGASALAASTFVAVTIMASLMMLA